MKKALAAVGATTLGAGAAVLPALPAAAEPVTDSCTSFEEHTLPVEELPDNWYMDCVPQYGLGKAEFTIWADDAQPATEEFPAEFLPLTDPGVVITTPHDPGIDSYFPVPLQYGNWLNLEEGVATPTSQTYAGVVAAPVTGVAALNEETFTEEMAGLCAFVFSEYEGTGSPAGYLATFGAIDTSFAQSVAGEDWTYRITATPSPTAFVFYPGPDGGLEAGSPYCATDGEGVVGGYEGQVTPLDQFVFQTVMAYPEVIQGEPLQGARFIGDFYHPDPVVEQPPVVPAAPTLPATGADPASLASSAGVLGAFGAGLLALVGMRRVARRRAD